MARKALPDISGIENVINVDLYGGKSFFKGVRDTKYRAEVISCDCEHCSLRDKGMCLKVTSPAYHSCEYGEKYVYEGFTPQAASCHEWNAVFRNHERYHKLSSLSSGVHFAVIGDSYFVYTTFVGVTWNEDGTYKFEATTSPKTHIFIKRDKADADFFVDLLTYKPYALLGGVIRDYPEQIVTLILNEMRMLAPELYEAVIEAEPSLAEKLPNFVGKRVYVKTLKPNIDIHIQGSGVFHLSAERNFLTCVDYHSAFLPFGAKSAELTIPVTDDMTYKVQSNDEACDDTEIAK